MAARHNLGTVIRFELLRTLKKKSFWAVSLSVPILIGVVFGMVFLSNKASIDKAATQKNADFSFAYTDDSGAIRADVMQAAKARSVADVADGIAQVKAGEIDAYFHYAKDLTKDGIAVYGKDVGLFNNNKYGAVASSLLSASAQGAVHDPNLVAALQGTVAKKSTTFTENGTETQGWMGVIAPMIFLVIFYMIIVMLGNNLLNSTVEEKENRVTEMILTTLNPTSLIVGKLLATLLAGIVQGLVVLLPALVVYFAFGSNLNIPSFDLSVITIEPLQLLFGSLILFGGLMVFTGSLVAIGAIMPTAKEAGQWFGVCMIAVFVPFYTISLILSDPSAMVVQFFLYFPLSAPVTALLLNAFGTLTVTQGIIVSIELLVVGVITIRLAVRLFRYGAMQYAGRLSLTSAFARKTRGPQQS